MSAMGIVASFGLGIAAKKFAVVIDPKVAEIDSFLPHANCGACGFAGCMGFAMAVAEGKAAVSGCSPGGASTAKKIASVMGVDAPEMPERMLAKIYCLGGHNEALEKGTGCGLCIPPCPKNLIELIPENKDVHIFCRSLDKGADTKKVCNVGCIACDKCRKVCPYDAITIDSFLARIDYNKCTNCGLCVPVCPTNIISDLIPVRDIAYVHEDCIGCLICKKVCPVDAIAGESKKLHIVDPVKCIGCTICADKCPPKVIEMRPSHKSYDKKLERVMSGVA